MDCNLPGSSIHWIFQTRILESVAMSFSRGSFWPRDWVASPALQADSSVWATPGSPKINEAPAIQRNSGSFLKEKVMTTYWNKKIYKIENNVKKKKQDAYWCEDDLSFFRREGINRCIYSVLRIRFLFFWKESSKTVKWLPCGGNGCWEKRTAPTFHLVSLCNFALCISFY